MLTYKSPLVTGEFIRRLNRFAAEVLIEGEVFRVFVPNSGRMQELLVPGATAYLLRDFQEHRKTAHDLVAVAHAGILVSVDSRVPNQIMVRWLEQGILAPFREFPRVKREVTVGASRLDFVLEGGGSPFYLEVKSVTLVEEGVARFPDAPTQRGRKHLEELQRLAFKGFRAGVVFVVQREDARSFAPNWRTDPQFAQALAQGAAAGVEVYAYRCRITPGGVDFDGEIPVEL